MANSLRSVTDLKFFDQVFSSDLPIARSVQSKSLLLIRDNTLNIEYPSFLQEIRDPVIGQVRTLNSSPVFIEPTSKTQHFYLNLLSNKMSPFNLQKGFKNMKVDKNLKLRFRIPSVHLPKFQL